MSSQQEEYTDAHARGAGSVRKEALCDWRCEWSMCDVRRCWGEVYRSDAILSLRLRVSLSLSLFLSPIIIDPDLFSVFL